MTEKTAYQMFRKAICVEDARINRVENPMVPGMPDVNYCIDGMEGWIEIKCPKEPKKEKTKLFGSGHKISKVQINWFLQQYQALGEGWVLIATGKTWMLIEQSHIKKINDMTLYELGEIAAWCCEHPPTAESWLDLRKILNDRISFSEVVIPNV